MVRFRRWNRKAAGELLGIGLLAILVGCHRGGDVTETLTKNESQAASHAGEKSAGRSTIRFTDVTEESGVQWTYQNGREAGNNSILESLGGGVALFDYDSDGQLDVFAPGGGGFEQQRIFGRPSVLFRNLGGWRFTNSSGPAGNGFPALHYSHGAFAGDYDNDGFLDLLVTGYGGLQLWRNQGDGTFTERHEHAALQDELWSSAAGWGDLNGDGFLDLYVAHYVNWSFANHPRCSGPRPDLIDICPPKVFQPLPDRLFYSNGDGTFRDVSRDAGLRMDGKGLGVVLGDIDRDSDVDIYVANDTTENFLYLNHGDGHFEEIGALAGVAVDHRGTPNGSMGVDLGDYNLDGRPDIWVANFEVESFALYRNDGKALFLHVSQATGVTALNGLFVGFGTMFADLDRDGDEDIVVANGHVINYPRIAPLMQLPLLLINDSGRNFRRELLDECPYFATPHAGRGLATGDIDNDGDLDLAFANNHEPLALLRNDSVDPSHWLQVKLVGRESNRDGVGAVLVLHTSSGDRIRMVKGGASYLSHSDLRPMWGISPKDGIHGLTIQWPTGKVQKFSPVSVDRTIVALEPE